MTVYELTEGCFVCVHACMQVEQLSRGQQVLVALVQEMHEDLMGLVAQQQGAAATAASAAAVPPTAGAAVAGASAAAPAAAGVGELGVGVDGGPAPRALKQSAAADGPHTGVTLLTPLPVAGPAGAEEGASSSSSSSSASSCTIAATQLQGVAAVVDPSRLGSGELSEGAAGLVRVSSVRGGVQAALAATVSQTLEL